MTEYDDTLIDMSDVDDRLDDETEASSSEIDEHRPSTSDSHTPDHETKGKEIRRLPKNFNNSTNPILVVSSKYYFHNPRPQHRPQTPTEENDSLEACQIEPDQVRPIEQGIGSTSTDFNENLISTPGSTALVKDTTPLQISSGELSDAEEDQDTSFVTANSSPVTNSTETCSSVADDSISEIPEAVVEPLGNAKKSRNSIPEAEADVLQKEPREGSSSVSEYLESCSSSATDLNPVVAEEINNVNRTDLYCGEDYTEQGNVEIVQIVAACVPELADSAETHDQTPEISVDPEEQAEQTKLTQVFAEAPENFTYTTNKSVDLEEEREGEEEDNLVPEENIVLESQVGENTAELEPTPDLEEVTEIIEQYTIPALHTTPSEPELTSPSPWSSSVVVVPTDAAKSNISSWDTFQRQLTQSEATPAVNMGENARVQEKLRQFEDNKKGESEDTRGSFTSSNSNLSDIEKQRRRNLIFDEERFEETFLKCLICREVYNESDKLPKMLHCHHTFCMDCLYQMYRVEGEFRQSLTGVFRHGMPMTVKIQCPTCREGIIISESELRRLPNDHTIMELLCFVNQTGKSEVQYCTKHQMQPLNFFCEPCIMPVCCDCTVIDHKESKGHIVVNVDEAMKKYTPIVEQTLSDIRQEKSNIVDKRAALEAAQDDLDRIQKDLARQVRSVFDSIREILDEREKELYDASEAEIERKRETLEGHIKTLAERDAMLNTEFNELQKAKDDKDISLIFTGHKSAREALAKKVYVPTNSTKGFSVTFQFSSRADSVIKQNVANLGDIIFQT